MPKKQLWHPSQELINSCNLTRFANSFGFEPPNYFHLHDWSINNKAEFWRNIWEFANVSGNRGEPILVNEDNFLTSTWFPKAQLNFTENLLQGNDDDVAIVSVTELGVRTELTFSELSRKVAQFASELTEIGVEAGDRVAAYLPNVAETVIAMLGTASIGAVWSSCSPDFGFQGAFDRFSQITPKVLIACDGYTYNGKRFNVSQNVRLLEQHIESIKRVITLNFLSRQKDDFDSIFLRDENAWDFQRFSFNQPLYVMYSSGTTGKPKCIVHGAGGTLIQHLKEHQLHVNLGDESTIFFFTTCGWMMWNWLVSALASGSTIVLYEGSAFWPNPNTLIQMIENERISVFGASAKYFSALEKSNVKPKTEQDLTSLISMQSTGSPLAPESFDYVHRDIKDDIQIASISGGTDLISCFALGVPWLPVNRGELQGPGLGMAVDVFDELGNSVRSARGELVCTKTFPSKPIGFWNDPEDEKYRAAYFDKFSNVWAHGDFAEINKMTGGLIIHGRSDAVLNPGGVRIGTAEIYGQVEAMSEITEALCVGQDWNDDVRVILFVVLAPNIKFGEDLCARIKQRLRANVSPRHVPAKIIAVPEIPRTRSGKIAELSVRDVIHGQDVGNTSALANSECLSSFENMPELTTD
ncbi:MAG: acetoacetate--CoA ligase [Gammaproteobacteria bacterium]|nr:acetoacetate--CoA ligase [Gammaproteobacteria bacterium]MYF03200.1 acetoacetate--CoA ligase [Gammaproteobacteria bacterium]MYI77372.1 acetoacetate--CoA ligase [Gammaproteobacteria bacterium]